MLVLTWKECGLCTALLLGVLLGRAGVTRDWLLLLDPGRAWGACLGSASGCPGCMVCLATQGDIVPLTLGPQVTGGISCQRKNSQTPGQLHPKMWGPPLGPHTVMNSFHIPFYLWPLPRDPKVSGDLRTRES